MGRPELRQRISPWDEATVPFDLPDEEPPPDLMVPEVAPPPPPPPPPHNTPGPHATTAAYMKPRPGSMRNVLELERGLRALSVKDFAMYLGISAQGYRKIVRNNSPSLKTMLSIAEVLDWQLVVRDIRGTEHQLYIPKPEKYRGLSRKGRAALSSAIGG